MTVNNILAVRSISSPVFYTKFEVIFLRYFHAVQTAIKSGSALTNTLPSTLSKPYLKLIFYPLLNLY
jgi:hypothetical protein